jgi:uncharacterized membrane protein
VTEDKKKWLTNPGLKCLWLLGSCLLGILAIFLILIFYFMCGCAYEFVKCYVERKFDDEDEDGDFSDRGEKEDRSKNKGMIGFLIALGILCQPLYLIFYMLYGLMECYRRFNCWFYYFDY